MDVVAHLSEHLPAPRLYVIGGRFFFSSRRRHTRFDCDWSSDVCSSDLSAAAPEKAMDENSRAPSGSREQGFTCSRLQEGPGDAAIRSDASTHRDARIRTDRKSVV